jgi:putative transposase
MPRRPRVSIDGGLYHVYNRAAHGAPVFASNRAGEKFVELLAEVTRLDDHLVYAWVCLPNHFHVVVRTSAVSLARSFGRVQSAFGRWRNRALRSKGPTWQSRYRAKFIEDESYLRQLIAYVHLNPVSAGLVQDPAEYKSATVLLI